ncbi:MAG: ABC transporter permease [Treponemataceae bacterium]
MKSVKNKLETKSAPNKGVFYSWPMGIWFIIFFVIPLIIILIYSFLQKGLYGGIEWKLSFDAYKQMFNKNYGIVLWRTIWISLFSTVITIVIAFPCGYAMAKSRHQTLFLLLIIIPFWTNSLIRIFAWMSIFSSDGIVNSLLMNIGLIDTPISLLYNKKAVILVSVYMYLPYAILPIFTSIDKFDFSLLEAARDLGCKKLSAVRKVLLPSVKSGILTAIIFTFIPIFGTYTVPLLVGGKGSYMLGNIIVDQVTKTRNWPLAAAFSIIITIISTAGVMLVTVSGKKEASMKLEKKQEKR